jgi:hypothetical protein
MKEKTSEFENRQAEHRSKPLARMGRMAICVLSFGMIYPNAFIESVDVAAYDAENEAAAKK